MGADNSVDKSLEELWNWGGVDQGGLIHYTFHLQAEVRRLRDAAAQTGWLGRRASPRGVTETHSKVKLNI